MIHTVKNQIEQWQEREDMRAFYRFSGAVVGATFGAGCGVYSVAASVLQMSSAEAERYQVQRTADFQVFSCTMIGLASGAFLADQIAKRIL